MPPRRVLPNLTVQQLDYLVAAVDHDTHADAAAALGVTPSALSQGLSELGRRLGIDLFERAGRSMRVRPEAAPVVKLARRVVADTTELANYADDLRAGRAGRVRLGMIDVAAVHHFADTLHTLRTDRPDVELHLAVSPSSELLERLHDGQLDAAVAVVADAARDGIDLDGLDVTPLLEEPMFAYVAPTDVGVTSHQPDPEHPATWGPWVGFPASSHTRRLIARHLRQRGADYDVVAESHQPDVLREMTRLGIGWVVLPAVQAETGPAPLRRALPDPVVNRRLALVRRAQVDTSAALDDVLDRLVAAAGR